MGKLLTITETAERLGIGKRRAKRLVAERGLFEQIGKRQMVYLPRLREALMKGVPVHPPTPVTVRSAAKHPLRDC